MQEFSVAMYMCNSVFSDDNGHSIALEPTHKCVTVSQPDNDELENPIYSSVTYKDMENPAHSSITNTEDLENQASVTNEEIENPAYVVIGKEDIENPAYTSVTTDRYSSAHHYETIPYQTIAKQ